MNASNGQWWRNAQGIVAVITIATAILGFFYIRERQMWEASTRIAAVETRGANAIAAVDARIQRLEEVLQRENDRLNFLERKIDHAEFDIKTIKETKQ